MKADSLSTSVNQTSQYSLQFDSAAFTMGSSASMLSSKHFALMSQELRDEYDKLIAEGHDDDQIRSQLMGKFNVHLMNNRATTEAGDAVEPVSNEADGIMPPESPLMESEDGGNAENAVTTQAPTSKAKKVRKRRGTFENDEVVTSQAPISANINLVDLALAAE